MIFFPLAVDRSTSVDYFDVDNVAKHATAGGAPATLFLQKTCDYAVKYNSQTPLSVL